MKDPESRSRPSDGSSTAGAPAQGEQQVPGAQQTTTPETTGAADAMKSPPQGEAQASPRSGASHASLDETQADLDPDRPTLERELQSTDFAKRGFARLCDLADYFSHLVDARTTGVLIAEKRETCQFVLAVASTLKAAAQLVAGESDTGRLPAFALEAERYLAEGPQDDPIVRKASPEVKTTLRSGVIVQRKGGRGQAGRIHAIAQLKKAMLTHFDGLTQQLLNADERAFAKTPRRPNEHNSLSKALADELLFAITDGALAEMLHQEPAFEWDFDRQLTTITKAVVDSLRQADLGDPSSESKATHLARLDKLAERLISATLSSLGVSIDKDMFRDRRG